MNEMDKPVVMTPLQLSILVHYYGHADDYRFGDFTAPAVSDAIESFCLESGMLGPSEQPDYPRAKLQLTERGRFYVDALCRVPLPISVTRWEIP